MYSLRNFFCITVISFSGWFLFPAAAIAQQWTMPVDGKVVSSGQKITGAVITLYKNGQQLQQVVTTSNGKFGFELPPNAEYIIAVTKAGYITKKFKIITANVPADRAEAGNFNPFEPDVTLFEMPTAPEIAKRVEAILSQPIAIYQYIPSENNFNYDEKYTQSIQQKLSELADLQKQVEKEMEEKAKNAAVEAQKQLEVDKKYKAAISKADAAFNSKEYITAKAGYNEALGIKPGEAYPKQKLAEIDKLLTNANAQKELDAKYQAAIAKADKEFNTKDYAAAKTDYTEATGIKPSETYPKQKIAEIDKLLADEKKQKELDSKYLTAVAKGDNAFNRKDYTTSKAEYTDASGIKPSEQYPKTRIAEIDKLLADAGKQKELDAKYQAAITKGDAAFGTKDYASAKTAYTEATGLKPSEQYPKTKLSEIDKLFADAAKQKEIDAKYLAAISKGDNSFTSKDYSSAKSAYNEASGLKPSEAYPKQKLAEIDKILSSLEADKQKEHQYKDLINKADASFGTKDYAGAKSSYTQASGIKPAEQYPKTKITEIDKILADMAKAGELEKQYKELIAKADNLFTQKNYTSARSSYSDASSLKSSEQYPKNKITEIDKLLAELAAQKSAVEKDKLYSDAVAKGDKLFGSKEYAGSKSAYNEALGIKPAEQYPKTRIAEIDKLLSSLASQKEIDEKYKAVIAKADGAFGTKDYTAARAGYTEASGIKPAEQYPKTKLAEIDELMKKLSSLEIDKKYNEALSRGDKSFTAKEYPSSKSAYQEASALKPNEIYPKNRIAEIDKLLKGLSDKQNAEQALNNNYLASIARGDMAFKETSFANAKVAFNEALTYKPDEQYPKDKIIEIEKIEKNRMMAQAEKEKQIKYNQAIGRGDKAYSDKEYLKAKPAYEEALTYKPNEKYPADRIKQIDALLKNSQLVQNIKKEPKETPPVLSEEEKRKQYQSELRSKYPSGVTEEEFTEGSKTILRRVVIKEDYAGIFTKVTHNWGGIYCFKDGIPITEIMFDNDSK